MDSTSEAWVVSGTSAERSDARGQNPEVQVRACAVVASHTLTTPDNPIGTAHEDIDK